LVIKIHFIIEIIGPRKPKLVEGIRDFTAVGISGTPQSRVLDHIASGSVEHPRDSVCFDSMSLLIPKCSR
jgi:hypothetical protein